MKCWQLMQMNRKEMNGNTEHNDVKCMQLLGRNQIVNFHSLS